MRFTILLFSVFFVPLSVAGTSPGNSITYGIQIAQINYGALNDQVIEKCRVAYPETVPALTKAIAQWSEKNSEAIREIRQIAKTSLMRNMQLSDAAATLRLEQQSELLTNSLKSILERKLDEQLKNLCEGYVTQELQRLDFAARLTDIRKANANP